MSSSLIILFLLVAVFAANLPWLNQRFLLFMLPPGGKKQFWMEFVEWLVFYLLIGAIALGLEKKSTGELHGQDWEFYAVSFCLFIVFALPGFVYRHTLSHYFKS